MGFGMELDRWMGLKEIWHFDNRWQLILHRLFFQNTSLHVYRLGALEFLVDHLGGDAVGVRNTIVSRMYRDAIEKMQLPKPMSLIDIGANGGGVPMLLSHLGFQMCRIVCVEMNPNTFARLEFNLRNNFDCPLLPIQAAVCGKRKEFRLRLGQGSTSDSLYQSNNGINLPNRREYAIQGILFDDVFRSLFDHNIDWVDLAKVDIEGAEYEVFSNDGHDCIRRCRYLLMEIHPAPAGVCRNDLLSRLDELKFVCIMSSPETSVFLFANRSLH